MKLPFRDYFVWENKWSKWVVATFVGLFVLGLANECRAGDLYVGVGYTTNTEIQPFNPRGFALDTSYEINKWQAGLAYLENTKKSDETIIFNISRLVYFRDFSLGLGLQVNNETQLLPQWWNFHLQANYDKNNYRFSIEHASNAGFDDRNPGVNWFNLHRRF